MKSLIMALTLLCLLSGAPQPGEDFSCDKVGGVSGCVTMDEVRHNITGFASTDSNAPLLPAPTHQRVYPALGETDMASPSAHRM